MPARRRVLPLPKVSPVTIVKPYHSGDSKKAQVARMFDHIAHRYDFLNSLLSMGIDRYWRSCTLKSFGLDPLQKTAILDVATGTGALAIEAALRFPNSQITAVDISQGMLQKGTEMVQKASLQNRISMILADAEELPFEKDSFDAVCIAFGVRNFEDLQKGIADMKRVLKPGGKIAILEFSRPRRFPVKQLFHFYFKHILPLIGKSISKDPRAYSYLFESVQHFPDYERFTAIMSELGFRQCTFTPLTFGICTIYTGIK